MRRPALVRRIRRKLWGGRVDLRIYADGSVRARVDHPSNDPEVEMAMAGRLMSMSREWFGELGMAVEFGPVRWRDDP